MPNRTTQVQSIFQETARVLLRVLGVVALCALTQVSQPAVENKRVLILFNNDSYTATQVSIDRALRSTLKYQSAVPIETYSEYVGNTRSGTDYEAQFVALLKRKYEAKKFDVIFTIGQFPLGTLLRNRADVFPGTPIVSVAIDKRAVESLYPAPAMTGVWGEIAFKPNLALALTLHPTTKRVVIAHGASETDKNWADRAMADFRDYGSRLEFAELVGLTIPEMRNALANLQPDTIVFFISNIRDNAGNTYESPDYLAQVVDASTAPIYGTTDGQLGNGIIGGQLLSFEALGAAGANAGLRVLAGENPEGIGPDLVPSRPMFDWRQLQRWKIDESRLPPGSVIQFKQPTTWEEYKWYVIGLSVAVGIETLLIMWLVSLRIHRRQAETEKLQLSSRLKDIVSNVPGIVWESRTDPNIDARRTVFISDYVERMLGYSADEWLKKPPGFGSRIIPVEEDRERAMRESEEVMKTGKEGVSEFRWLTKDGRIRWVNNYLSPIFDGVGKVIGMRGVALDITNRKLAEEKASEAEEKDRAIMAAIPDLMFMQSEDGVYIDYHAKDVNELFTPPESFLGKNMREIFPPALAEKFAECFVRAEEGGEPQIVEYSLELDEAEKWFEARIVRSGHNMLSVIRDITDRKRAEQEAQQLSGRLISAQEDERARIARELHDDACQNLAVLAIELELFGQRGVIDKGSIEAERKALASRVSDISGDLRRLSHKLHPAILSKLGLVTSVRGFCHEIESTYDLKVAFKEENVPAVLPDATSLCVYRVVQESLQNVVKHSGATSVDVILHANGNGLQLTISDNGSGFNPAFAAPKGSLGLISMKERIRLVNGTISINSNGKGTRVEATIPV